MKWVFVYNAFGMEKCPFWKDINVNMYLDENHFERFPFYMILGKNLTELDEMSVGFKTFGMKIDETGVYLQSIWNENR